MRKLSNSLLGLGIILNIIGVLPSGLMSVPFARAECYTGGTYTCSGTNETCPSSQPCVRAIGTLVHKCDSSNPTTEHYERIYMAYPHNISIVEGAEGRSGLKDPENKKCLFEYRCQCKNSSEAGEQDQTPSCVGSNPNIQIPNAGITVEIREPDPNSSTCGG